jgi:hypothetical protein
MPTIKSPTANVLAPVEVLSEVEELCKAAAMCAAFEQYVAALKDHLLNTSKAYFIPKGVSTPFGKTTVVGGRAKAVYSALGKERVAALEAELLKSGDLKKVQGDDYMTCSPAFEQELGDIKFIEILAEYIAKVEMEKEAKKAARLSA